MKIVAFLQNMWVREPWRVHEGIERHGEEYRRRVTFQFLFGGCVTGRRIKAAFGDAIHVIEWDETTRLIADNPRTIFPAQPEHIRAVIAAHEPRIVLAFGRIAERAVRPLWSGPLIIAPHPAARQADVPAKLKDAADQLRAYTVP